MKIFLIGFPGSGKSFLGKELAVLTKHPFADTDALIEEKTGKTVTELFKEKGEDWFRKTESKVLNKLFKKRKFVAATGGGLPCFHDNMKKMNLGGITIYLKASEPFLYHRLFREKKSRPLMADLTDADLMEYIFSALSERRSFYEQAQIIVDAEKINAAKLLKKLPV